MSSGVAGWRWRDVGDILILELGFKFGFWILDVVVEEVKNCGTDGIEIR